jgi:predicted permease
MLHDLLLAIRGLRRSPVFAVVAIGSLVLGIGANTAIFSFVNAILLTRLPVPNPERLVSIAEYQNGKEISSVFSYPFIEELNKHGELFSGVSGRFPVRVNLATDNATEPLHGEVVTGAYFRTLQVKPALGRLITEGDVVAGTGNPVCVLSYAMWQIRFAADPHIVGRTLMLNAHPYRVIGVTQSGFNGAQLESRVDMQLPVSRIGDFMGGFFGAQGGPMWRSAGFSWLEPFGRLKDDVSRGRALAMFQPLAKGIHLQLANPQNRQKVASEKAQYRLVDASQGPAHDDSKRLPLLVLMAIVGLILFIACLNLANLLLAKAKTREKEFALRLSLGASRLRIVRQLLSESLAIGILGGAFGILCSVWLTRILLLYFNGTQSMSEGLQVHLDFRVICFAIILSLITAILFGLAPAWQSTKVDLLPGLKEAQTGLSAGRDRAYLRKTLTVVQLAISVCLLFGAGLLARTLSHLQTVDLGFKPAQVIALAMDPAMAGYRVGQIDRIFDKVVNRLQRDPSILAASYAVVTPLEGSMISLDIEVPGHLSKDSDQQTDFNMISLGYFKTLQQHLLAGRDFSARDTRNSAPVAIVNEVFVKQYMPGMNPIGRYFKQGGKDVEIVGLAPDSHYGAVREIPMPLIYLPAAQNQSSGYNLLVRTRENARHAIPQIERAIRTIDKRLPIYNVRTLQAQIDGGISSERILSFLSELFAVLATLLCAIGLYGIIAYGVASRIREIGIRFALGATRPGVVRLFLYEGSFLLVTGIAVGAPAALGASRVLQNLLYGLKATDLATLASMIGIVLLVGFSAILIPVLRAAQIQPSEALRNE